METIAVTLKIFDQMSQPIQSIIEELNLTILVMDNLSNIIGTSLTISFKKSSNIITALTEKVKGLIKSFFSFETVKQGMRITDDYINENSKLGFANDGLQSQAKLQDNVYQAAQRSRVSYGEMASSVSKLDSLPKDTFSNNTEAITFAELMNKSLRMSGATSSESNSSMDKITEIMAKGNLQGSDFDAIAQNNPIAAKAIEEYTGTSITELSKMASSGTLTADIIKNALFNASDDINAKFQTMPQTFDDIWNSIKNKAITQFGDIMNKVSQFINSDVGIGIVDGIVNAIGILSVILSGAIDLVIAFATFFIENWSMIVPIILGVIAALLVYNATMGIAWLTTLKDVAVKIMRAIASGIETAAIIALIIAQDGLNAAIAACPITWIIICIIILITLFYVAIAAINHFAGTSISATGLIAGAFMVAIAFIGNLFVTFYNLVIDIIVLICNQLAVFAEFFANVFNDPIGSIIRLFAGMADTVLGILSGIASAIDTIFGSNLASAVNGWRSGLSNVVNKFVGNPKVKVSRMDSQSMHLDRFEYKQFFNSGYNAGEKFESSISDKFNGLGEIGKMPDVLGKEFLNGETMPQISPIAQSPVSGLNDNAGKGINQANDHLKNIDDKIDISNEYLEMMRDLAEEKSISNFVTLTPTVQVTTGDVKEQADINKIISAIENYMEQELENSAEGLYA